MVGCTATADGTITAGCFVEFGWWCFYSAGTTFIFNFCFEMVQHDALPFLLILIAFIACH
jgi:hypothetical protein